MRAAVLGPIVLSVPRGGNVDCLRMGAFVFRFLSRRAACRTLLVTVLQAFCVVFTQLSGWSRDRRASESRGRLRPRAGLLQFLFHGGASFR